MNEKKVIKYILKLKKLKINREKSARKHEKFSCKSAISRGQANAYDLALDLFLENFKIKDSLWQLARK